MQERLDLAGVTVRNERAVDDHDHNATENAGPLFVKGANNRPPQAQNFSKNIGEPRWALFSRCKVSLKHARPNLVVRDTHRLHRLHILREHVDRRTRVPTTIH